MAEPARLRATTQDSVELNRARLVERTPPAMVNLRGASDDLAFGRAVSSVLGCALPARANSFETAGGSTVVWLGPDEWLVVGVAGSESRLVGKLEVALAAHHASVVDVSGHRAFFCLSGPGARTVMEKGCAIDLHPRAFGPGQAVQTWLARAQVLLIQRDDIPTYDLLPRRSFASYLRSWLEDAMAGQ